MHIIAIRATVEIKTMEPNGRQRLHPRPKGASVLLPLPLASLTRFAMYFSLAKLCVQLATDLALHTCQSANLDNQPPRIYGFRLPHHLEVNSVTMHAGNGGSSINFTPVLICTNSYMTCPRLRLTPSECDCNCDGRQKRATAKATEGNESSHRCLKPRQAAAS